MSAVANIISLEEFQNIFAPPPAADFDSFLCAATVRCGPRRIVPLLLYAAEKEITAADLEYIWHFIDNHKVYLRRFYNMSMRQPATELAEEPPAAVLNNNQKNTYKNIPRNLFWREILENTTSGIVGVPTFMRVLRAMVEQLEIDYKILTPSSLFYVRKNRMSSVLSSLFFRSSIMNPYLVYSIIRREAAAARTIFTPTLGWCSYLLGATAALPDARGYVGIDVIPEVCATAAFMSAPFPKQIYCCPSEDFLGDAIFFHQYAGWADFIFFSPPYYDMELYTGEEQSTARYRCYTDWLTGYWEKTIKLCSIVAAPQALMVYIISDYGKYNLVKDMNEITARYFTLEKKETMLNKNVHVTAENHRETGETICFWRAAPPLEI